MAYKKRLKKKRKQPVVKSSTRWTIECQLMLYGKSSEAEVMQNCEGKASERKKQKKE